MSGKIKVSEVLLGQSADQTKNFKITVPAVPDGTLTIERGDGTDVLTVAANGLVSFPQGSQMIGVGQTWQTLTGSRVAGTTYTNTTGKPIQISVTFYSTTTAGYGNITVGGVSFGTTAQAYTGSVLVGTATAIVPPGATYSATATNSTISSWHELR